MDVKIYNDDFKFKFRVSGIVIHDGKILVSEYGKSTYCLPGGYVQFKETSQEAILREMKEETGFEYKVINFGGIIENFFVNQKKQKTHEIDFYYYLKLKSPYRFEDFDMERIEQGSYRDIEHHFKWVDIKDIEQYHLLPSRIKSIIKNNENSFHLVIKE